jgi:hypothetical protein
VSAIDNSKKRLAATRRQPEVGDWWEGARFRSGSLAAVAAVTVTRAPAVTTASG